MTQSLYLTNDDKELRELADAADVYLQGQLTAAVAADQRALVFAGFLAAAIAAIGTAAGTVLTGTSVDHKLGFAALFTAAALVIAMILAVAAAMPTRWFFPGSHPQDWQQDFANSTPRIQRLQELLADYDDRITKNHTTMKTKGRLLLASALVTVIVFGIAAGFLMYTFVF